MTQKSYLPLEAHLRTRRDSGSKLLIPYVTAGYSDEWLETVLAIAAAGPDAIEIGIPFSDPIMDGPVIQAASQIALERGVTPISVFRELSSIDVGVPLIAMTYCNLLFHAGFERFLGGLKDANISGTIFPDLPMEEAVGWSELSANGGVANVLLVSPSTPVNRAKMICSASSGFVYGIGLMGVTGARESLSASASVIAKSLKGITDQVVMVGIGISNPIQAREVAQVSDGVIIGSALVRILLDGGGPIAAHEFVSSVRRALDEVY